MKIDEANNKMKNFQNSSKAEDVLDVIDEQEDKLVAVSGMYDQALENTRKREQMDEVKKHVKETLAGLKDKASQQREAILLKEKKSASNQLMAQLFFADKTEYLVKKFVNNLKIKVKERKDNTIN